MGEPELTLLPLPPVMPACTPATTLRRARVLATPVQVRIWPDLQPLTGVTELDVASAPHSAEIFTVGCMTLHTLKVFVVPEPPAQEVVVGLK